MSQRLRDAYISMVTAVHEARLAASSSCGLGPASLPPDSVGSSAVTSWLRIRTTWRKPSSRVAVAFILINLLPVVYSSGLNRSPVGTLGKKNVDFGGMFTPAAATSRTWATGVARRK